MRKLKMSGQRPGVRPLDCVMFAAMCVFVAGASLTELSAAPRPLPTFALPTTTSETCQIGTDPTARWYVICFLGTECPLAQLYGPRLAQLADEFSPQNCRFIGVYSNRQDSLDEVRTYAERHQMRFVMAKDDGHQAAAFFGATRTPEVFVVNAQMEVLYQGRIDNQYQPGIARPKATQHDLRDALTALVRGEMPEIAKTEAVGCLIGREKSVAQSGDITFCRDVAPILNRHCVECHRQGEIGPFSLTDYDEIVGWSDMIVEVVDNGRMPPWHADPRYGQFANARQMPEQDREVLRAWAAAGTPYGNAADLPQQTDWNKFEVSLEPPDAEFVMAERPFKIPAEGTVDYQYFVVDPKFTEDKWVWGAEVVPGNRSVVHHVIVFIRPPDGHNPRGVSWLTAYVPGQRPTKFPDGHARHVPAGSRFAFQMHYTPNGQATEDLTKVRLYFASPDKVTHEVFTLAAMDQEFEIPPHAKDHIVPLSLKKLPEQSRLLGVAPHMHLRGKSFRLTGQQSSEGARVLLDVPHYDFNWQHFYEFAEPLPLDTFQSFACEVGFDNSAENLANPDPTQRVTWGDQTWEEMAIAFFEVAQPRSVAPAPRKHEARSEGTQSSSNKAQVEEFVNDFLRRFDRNGDGLVARGETPNGFRRFGFGNFDENADEFLDRDEIRRQAEMRL